jgi:transcriptional regulator with GAF, ATPase, and Fis domain
MRNVLEQADRVATAHRTTVAIYGESGSGKEVLARAIHFAGNGLAADFVAVNCAAIPDHLLESELFGHVRGAFTSADRDREGKFSLAREGTILLDEVGDMPLPLQAKLLRVLQERVFEKLGSNTLVPVRCRVIIATGRNLAAMVESGEFREDLYHRINVFPLRIPPLRDRKADLEILCKHFLEELRQHFGKPLPGITNKAMDVMAGYHWPGNIRELHNCLERAAILTDAEPIGPEHLGMGISPFAVANFPATVDSVSYGLTLPTENLSLEALNAKILAITLERCKGNKSKAAQMLKINRKAFYRS